MHDIMVPNDQVLHDPVWLPFLESFDSCSTRSTYRKFHRSVNLQVLTDRQQQQHHYCVQSFCWHPPCDAPFSFTSIQFNSIQFNTVNSIQFNSIQYIVNQIMMEDPVLSMHNEKEVVRSAGRQAISAFLEAHNCYSILRDSGKMVVFDTRIPIQLAFYALVEHGTFMCSWYVLICIDVVDAVLTVLCTHCTVHSHHCLTPTPTPNTHPIYT